MRNLEVETDLILSYGDSFAFDENFKLLRYSGFRTSSVALYLDYGNLSDEYDIEQDCIIKDTRENRVKIKWDITRQGYQKVSELEGNLDELIADIGGVDHSNIEELRGQLDELRIAHTSNYERTSTRGYSQGDYADILVNVAEYKEKMGADFELEPMKKWFDHYFWDSPIYGTINVCFEYTKNAVNFKFDREFDFNEFTLNEYNVDELDIGSIINVIENEVVFPLSGSDIKEIKKKLGDVSYQDVTSPCSC